MEKLVRIFVLAAVLLTAGTDAGAVEYEAIILHPSGFSGSRANGISGGGQQVGSGYIEVGTGRSHALLWSGTAESVVDLHSSGFYATRAYGIAAGQQVGRGWVGTDFSDSYSHALLWSGTAESVIDLNPAGFDNSGAVAVSNGQQVGHGCRSTSEQSHALLWSGTAESVVDLHPSEFDGSYAYDISGNRQVGRGSWLRENEYGQTYQHSHALLWSSTADSVVDLHPNGFNTSRAFGISEGQQVGEGTIEVTGGSFQFRALLWSGTAESMVNLHPSGFSNSYAHDTSGGQQVGWGAVEALGNVEHALLWSGTPESVVDLHAYLPTGYHRSVAYGIDSAGNIVGFADNHAVLWLVPEPATLLLFGLGAMMLRKRR